MLRFNRVFRDGGGFDSVLVLFALAYLVAFSAFPLIYNFVISFQSVDLFTIATFDRPFVGLDNYREIIDDPLFMPIVRNTFLFVFLSVIFQLGIGLALALFFRLDFPGASWLRGLFLAGWIMPGLVVGAIWGWILAGDFGVVAGVRRDNVAGLDAVTGRAGAFAHTVSGTPYALWAGNGRLYLGGTFSAIEAFSCSSRSGLKNSTYPAAAKAIMISGTRDSTLKNVMAAA